MYVLDGEVMFNELPPYFEKSSSRHSIKVAYKNSPVPCHDQQQIHLPYLMESKLRSESQLVQEKVIKDLCYAYFDYPLSVPVAGSEDRQSLHPKRRSEELAHIET